MFMERENGKEMDAMDKQHGELATGEKRVNTFKRPNVSHINSFTRQSNALHLQEIMYTVRGALDAKSMEKERDGVVLWG